MTTSTSAHREQGPGQDQLLLELADLRAGYDGRTVLHGIDLALAPGSTVAVLGANGAGKSTLLRAICAIVDHSGIVRYAGRRIEHLATEDIARLGVALVPQGHGTFKDLSTEENLRVGGCVRHGRAGLAAALERVYGYFPRLKERRRQNAGTLSGGEQQMLAIGRALMLAPRLLLLDEPSAGLAPAAAHALFTIVETVSAAEGVGVLLVEQSVEAALALAETVYLLDAGRVVYAGASSGLHGDAAARAYLGT